VTLKEILVEFSNDDLIYCFLPIFMLALILEWLHSKKENLGLFDPGDTKASL